jgi:hypothetical protein
MGKETVIREAKGEAEVFVEEQHLNSIMPATHGLSQQPSSRVEVQK